LSIWGWTHSGIRLFNTAKNSGAKTAVQSREIAMKGLQRTAAAIAVAFITSFIGSGHAAAQIKIGAVLSATGPASFLGDPEKKTLEI